jgi:hypothetical protein
MGLYADAMKDTELDGLKETYTGAAQFANKACGEGYAQTNTSDTVLTPHMHIYLDYFARPWKDSPTMLYIRNLTYRYI